MPGYKPVQETADRILCSHRHQDHCGAKGAALWEDVKASPFTVETIQTWHDDRQGALRGADTIHILDDGQCRAAHLGDLGCDLTPDQKDKLRNLTALLIPVGGYYTIDAAQANKLADELTPDVIVPMHYRGEGFGYDVIGTLDAFTALRSDVKEYPSSTLELTPGMERQTAVLRPQNI